MVAGVPQSLYKVLVSCAYQKTIKALPKQIAM
jgi:hypothetical protein